MSQHPYDIKHEVGDHNLERFGLDIHNPVFPVSSVLVVLFIAGTLMFPETAIALLNQTKNSVIEVFDQFLMSSANFFVLFCLALAVSPLGKIRIGGVSAKADYTYISWFAMLFSAGMGIGLMFWSVAEPIAYTSGWFHTPLNVAADTERAHHLAMAATLYHWTIHPWAIYAIVGLSLAFFYYSKRLPLTLRSAFYPILSDRVWGWPGHIVDMMAVVATIFGLATSLGLGAQQAAGGISYLFGFTNDTSLQVGIIVFVTCIALGSVLRGLDGGVKHLSNLNMGLAMLLLCFVFLLGPTYELLMNIFSNVKDYFTYLLPLSDAGERVDKDWQHGWTVFYWAWWISWSPFVGMFIARISKGRSVREFILAVLIVPSMVTLVWMTVFGETALLQYENKIGELSNGITDVSLSMFQMLAQLPLASITSFVAIVLVLVFFVTSSDSGSLVIDSITAGGKIDAPVVQRTFWVVVEGGIAVVLLIAGGDQALKALQAGAVSAGLPFTFLLILMCFSLLKALINEWRQLEGLAPIMPPDSPSGSNNSDQV